MSASSPPPRITNIHPLRRRGRAPIPDVMGMALHAVEDGEMIGLALGAALRPGVMEKPGPALPVPPLAMACKHSNQARRAAASSFWSLVDAGEPFRILFPLGSLIGIIGVALWPLYVWKVLPDYPGMMHSRIMIMGFLTSFVVGFLGTAFPRLLDVPRLRAPLSLAIAIAISGGTIAHLLGRATAGDIIFTSTLLALVGTLAMLTRVSADWMPAIRLSHYGYAGLSWIGGVVVWMWSVLPGVTRSDGE